MPQFADVLVGPSFTQNQYQGGGTDYMVQANNGHIYLIYMTSSDCRYRKSTDDGLSWGNPVTIIGSISSRTCAVWYDRWSAISGDLIHVAVIDDTSDDVLYRNINTASSDALGTQTTAFAGASTATGSILSITRARGGNLGIFYNIDGGTERGFVRSTDVGANWGARADPTEAATDTAFLLPGWNADNQDIQCIFWDASANEISVKRYDDSADSWAESSIATSMTYVSPTTGYMNINCTVDLTNSQNLVVAWSARDTANADLRCWKVTDSSITETTTNVVLNSTDDQTFCAIGIDTVTDYWWVIYAGKSDGSETVSSSLNYYYKISKDGGANWGPETKLTNRLYSTNMMFCSPRFTNWPKVAWQDGGSGTSALTVNVPIPRPRAALHIGI